MFTQEQLLKAVRKAGRNGPFTCAAVRECLGVSTRDKKQLGRFHTEFRALQKAAPEVFEKVGKNAYLLKLAAPAPAAVSSEPAPLVEVSVTEAAITELPEVEQVITRAPEHVSFDERYVELEIEIEPEPEPALESLDKPLQLIEVDFDVNELQLQPTPETQAVEELIRRDVPPQPTTRSWFYPGQWLGRRVAEFFGRS